MKLKNRIYISFFVIILVPMFLISLALMAFTSYQVHSIKKQYGIEEITYESLSNNTYMLSKITQKVCDNLQKTVNAEPEKMENTGYLDSINEELLAKNAYLLVRKGEECFYNGSGKDVQIVFSELPVYGDATEGSDRGVYIGEDVQALVKQVDFQFTDGVVGTAFIIIKADAMIPQVQRLLADMVLVMILILVITAFGLCTWTYRGVITPLSQLKEATRNIKEGNLDFTVEKSGVQEISALC